MWVWWGVCYVKTSAQVCPRALVFLVQKQLLVTLEKKEKAGPRREKQAVQRFLGDSKTHPGLFEDTSFHTDKVQGGLQDASSLQNVGAPTCGLDLRLPG